MKTFELSEPCRRRPVRFLELLESGGWRLKVYGIAYGRPEPRPELLEAARALAVEAFPSPAEGGGRYGVGYLGVHDGRGADFVFADWWAEENELHHRVFVSSSREPLRLGEVTASGLSACVWDLRVICHEREAWLRHVLRNPGGAPDLDAYLADTLDCQA